MRKYINELPLLVGEEVEVCCFLRRVRDFKDFMFLTVLDITDNLQVFIDKSNIELVKKVKDITLESAIKLKGIVRSCDKTKSKIELYLNDIICYTKANNMLPIDFSGKTNTSNEIKLDYRYLDLRTRKNMLIFKISTYFEMMVREFLIDKGFMEIHSPKIINTPSEGGAEVFELNYFNKKAYLAQSPQFYKQMVMASGFDKVFEIGGVYRADRSHTNYHATEFTGLDIEMSFINSVEDVMDLEEDMLKYAINKVIDKYKDEIKDIFDFDLEYLDYKFPRIKLDDAIKIVKDMNHSNISNIDGDLDNEAEKLICKYVKEKYNSDFVFITDYPFSKRPFYHMKDIDDKSISKSFDLLYNGVEITTGSQREHRLDVLKSQIQEKNLEEDMLKFYLDFFKYGMPPHGGFGCGVARIIMSMLHLDSIKDTTLLFRNQNRLLP